MKGFAGEIDVDLTKIQGLNNIADVEKLKNELDAMKKMLQFKLQQKR